MKYYIEVCEFEDVGYILQSQWFDSEKQAINFFNKFDFIDKDYEVWLMCAEWNNEEKTYTDIKTLKKLSK